MKNIVISPLTGKENVTIVNSFSVLHILKKWNEQLQIDISSEFYNTNIFEFDLYRCDDTKLLFFHPKFEGSPFIYKELQNKFEWYYVEDKWEYDVAIEDIKNAKNCLEIGAGSGAFIKKALSYNINIIGLETSIDAVEKAKKFNLPVYLKSIEETVQMFGNKPDVVLAFQVLEHIANPLSFIRDMIDVLPVGGRLIICVPDANSFYKYDDNVLDMPPHHQTRWSLEAFKNFEKIFPLRLKKVRYEPLSHWHIGSWIEVNSKVIRKNNWYGKLIFNRFSKPIIRKILSTNIRSFFKGHTIYVNFEKI